MHQVSPISRDAQRYQSCEPRLLLQVAKAVTAVVVVQAYISVTLFEASDDGSTLCMGTVVCLLGKWVCLFMPIALCVACMLV